MDCKKTEARIDFLQYLETDISLYIMSFLHDPADLVRASSVSHFWHRFAEGSPNVYSAKSVRFRICQAKSPRENETDLITDDEVEWTYTSPEFPMKQEHKVQPFKLSQPVLCFGGYLKIELLGRVQRHQKVKKMDCSIYV